MSRSSYTKQEEALIAKTSVVKAVTPNGSWNDLLTYEYVLENGEILNVYHKKESVPFAVGTHVEFVITREHPIYGKTGKLKRISNLVDDTAPYNKGMIPQDSLEYQEYLQKNNQK